MNNNAVNKVKTAIDHARQGFDQFEQAARTLSGGPASYYFQKIEEYVAALFDKYAPFKTGDRVMLIGTPDTNNNWRTCAHFLVPGSAGLVHGVDYSKGRFVAEVEFDNESWIDTDGNPQPVTQDRKHVFCIGEELLKKI